jgi:hypothetical protein
MTDDIEVVEEPYGYSKQSQLSLSQIVLLHVRKMSDLSCQELCESFWESKPIKVGSGVIMSKIYHPDLREAFCNSVDFLFSLVRPNLFKDKSGKFKKKFEEIEEDLDKKFKEDKNKSQTQSEWVQQKLEIKKKLFAEIMSFLTAIKFFEGGSFGE